MLRVHAVAVGRLLHGYRRQEGGITGTRTGTKTGSVIMYDTRKLDHVSILFAKLTTRMTRCTAQNILKIRRPWKM